MPRILLLFYLCFAIFFSCFVLESGYKFERFFTSKSQLSKNQNKRKWIIFELYSSPSSVISVNNGERYSIHKSSSSNVCLNISISGHMSVCRQVKMLAIRASNDVKERRPGRPALFVLDFLKAMPNTNKSTRGVIKTENCGIFSQDILS